MALASHPLYAQKIADAKDNTPVNFLGKPVESKELTLTDFGSVHASTNIKVVVRKSDIRKVLIKSNAMRYVSATVEGGELSLHYSNHNTSLNNPMTEVIVYTPNFGNLDADLASTITVEDGFKLGNLTVKLRSSANIFGSFEAKNININANSAAHFSGKVQAKKLNLNGGSSARIEVSGFAKDVDADASSAAEINLSGLRYDTIQVNESSLGKVVPK